MELNFTQDTQIELFLSDVKENQFFVFDGNLYQKSSPTLVNLIADRRGKPRSLQEQFDKFTKIERILPEVTKISF